MPAHIRPLKIIVAPDSMKGVLGAPEAAGAIATGARKALDTLFSEKNTSVRIMPIADGGEGTAETLGVAYGAEKVEADTLSPLLTPMRASYYFLYRTDDNGCPTAFIDLAAASGLPLVEPSRRNPLDTSTFGTGMLIADAARRGARHIIVGAGGSATTDGGTGALQAMGAVFSDREGKEITRALRGRDMERIASVKGLPDYFRSIRITIASDVAAPLYGPEGAAMVFAPQKGASTTDAIRLDRGLTRFADTLAACGFPCAANIPGSGAAGGFAAGMSAVAGAEILPGAQMVLEAVRLREELTECSLLITGEGCADGQTLMEKAPFAAMKMAKEVGVPAILLAGRVMERQRLLDAGFLDAIDINRESTYGNPLDPSIARSRLEAASFREVCRFLGNPGQGHQ